MVEKPLARKWYESASYIPRSKLRRMLPKLRANLNAIVDGIGRPMDTESIHNQSVLEMGNYTNYKYAQPRVAPLRELVQAPERVDAFGNPFTRKSNTCFLVDEVSVDDVGFSGPASFQSQRSAFKSRGRVKGPLPSDFRLYVSRPNSPVSSPYSLENRSHSRKFIFRFLISEFNLVPDLSSSTFSKSHPGLNGAVHLSREETISKINGEVIRELAKTVRSTVTGNLNFKTVNRSF